MNEEMNEETKVSAAEVQPETNNQPAEAEEQMAEVTDAEIADRLAELLAEAERRGYLKARNEIASALLRRPQLWENERLSEARRAESQEAKTEGSEFLRRIKPSAWD